MRRTLPILFLTLVTALSALAVGPDTADALINKAQAQAKAQGKSVFVAFHASWCGWCKKMESYLSRPSVKPIWDKHFVTVWLTVNESEANKKLETPGGVEWLSKLGGDGQGIPFFAVMTSAGTVASDSRRMEKGKRLGNIGFPAAPEEIAWFESMLKSSKRMTKAEIATLRKELAVKS